MSGALPCFDAFDHATENLRQHHFLVFHKKGMTAARASDDSTSVTVPDNITGKKAPIGRVFRKDRRSPDASCDKKGGKRRLPLAKRQKIGYNTIRDITL